MRDSMLGKVFALSDAEEQAEFLNVAARTLKAVCRVHDGYEDMQMCRIAEYLDGDGRRFIKDLAEFVKVDEETPRVEKRIVYEDVIEKRIVPTPEDEHVF
jgi:hypothetical protein